MKNLIAFIALIFILGLSGASFWIGQEEEKLIAPTRLVEGPDDSVYVLAVDTIYAMSSDGKILKSFNVEKDLDIHETISDFYVEPDGGLLIGLQASQTIRIYSPEGKYLRDHYREPSPFSSQETRDFLFTKDPESGKLFVSDPFHDRVQVYNSYEEKTETYTEFSGEDLNGPTGVLFKEGKLYIVDKFPKRIIILNERGELEGEVPLEEVSDKSHFLPIRFSRQGDLMVLLTWSREEGSEGILSLTKREALKRLVRILKLKHDVYILSLGEVSFDAEASSSNKIPVNSKKIYSRTGEDFLDVLARSDDVLIADPEMMKVFRVSPDGELMGEFGSGTLGEALDDLRKKRRVLSFTQIGAWFGIVISLLGLIYAGRKDIQG